MEINCCSLSQLPPPNSEKASPQSIWKLISTSLYPIYICMSLTSFKIHITHAWFPYE